jgi:hypothetical protein
LALAYPLTIIVAVPLFLLLSKAGLDGSIASGVRFVGFDALSSLYTGVLVGWIVGKRFPALMRGGAWVWAVPTAVILFDLVPGSQIAHYGYVYTTGDNEGLGTLLITLPTCSAIGYSIGIVLATVERRHPKMSNIRSKAAVLLFWSVTFAIACTFMRDIERRTVERDKNLRFAVRLSGTALAADAMTLCRTSRPDTSDTMILQSITRLKLLNHAACPSGEHFGGLNMVEVEDGPNKGRVGWVLATQVWRPLRMP